ncbi:hypothetical protein ES703_119977 [subsurface metagenome]
MIGLGKFAFGIAAAGEKLPETPRLDSQGFAALRAGFLNQFVSQLYPFHYLGGIRETLLKGCIEIPDYAHPVSVIISYLVQLLLHTNGELDVNDVGKVFNQQVIDHASQFRGLKPPFGFSNIFPLLNGGEDGGIGAGASDTPLL